ncbi:hypothetical protein Ciccas_012999 [Cichlidogyrus casuarinus]|uniref:Uncharacterized protein n=1 Tax=Cichlidogyrus casuarinus TaxID=1844966 RepID=A0ABD2PLR1_9PLAT
MIDYVDTSSIHRFDAPRTDRFSRSTSLPRIPQTPPAVRVPLRDVNSKPFQHKSGSSDCLNDKYNLMKKSGLTEEDRELLRNLWTQVESLIDELSTPSPPMDKSLQPHPLDCNHQNAELRTNENLQRDRNLHPGLHGCEKDDMDLLSDKSVLEEMKSTLSKFGGGNKQESERRQSQESDYMDLSGETTALQNKTIQNYDRHSEDEEFFEIVVIDGKKYKQNYTRKVVTERIKYQQVIEAPLLSDGSGPAISQDQDEQAASSDSDSAAMLGPDELKPKTSSSRRILDSEAVKPRRFPFPPFLISLSVFKGIFSEGEKTLHSLCTSEETCDGPHKRQKTISYVQCSTVPSSSTEHGSVGHKSLMVTQRCSVKRIEPPESTNEKPPHMDCSMTSSGYLDLSSLKQPKTDT